MYDKNIGNNLAFTPIIYDDLETSEMANIYLNMLDFEENYAQPVADRRKSKLYLLVFQVDENIRFIESCGKYRYKYSNESKELLIKNYSIKDFQPIYLYEIEKYGKKQNNEEHLNKFPKVEIYKKAFWEILTNIYGVDLTKKVNDKVNDLMNIEFYYEQNSGDDYWQYDEEQDEDYMNDYWDLEEKFSEIEMIGKLRNEKEIISEQYYTIDAIRQYNPEMNDFIDKLQEQEKIENLAEKIDTQNFESQDVENLIDVIINQSQIYDEKVQKNEDVLFTLNRDKEMMDKEWDYWFGKSYYLSEEKKIKREERNSELYHKVKIIREEIKKITPGLEIDKKIQKKINDLTEKSELIKKQILDYYDVQLENIDEISIYEIKDMLINKTELEKIKKINELSEKIDNKELENQDIENLIDIIVNENQIYNEESELRENNIEELLNRKSKLMYINPYRDEYYEINEVVYNETDKSKFKDFNEFERIGVHRDLRRQIKNIDKDIEKEKIKKNIDKLMIKKIENLTEKSEIVKTQILDYYDVQLENVDEISIYDIKSIIAEADGKANINELFKNALEEKKIEKDKVEVEQDINNNEKETIIEDLELQHKKEASVKKIKSQEKTNIKPKRKTNGTKNIEIRKRPKANANGKTKRYVKTSRENVGEKYKKNIHKNEVRTNKVSMWMDRLKATYSAVDNVPQKAKPKVLRMKNNIEKTINRKMKERANKKENEQK